MKLHVTHLLRADTIEIMTLHVTHLLLADTIEPMMLHVTHLLLGFLVGEDEVHPCNISFKRSLSEFQLSLADFGCFEGCLGLLLSSVSESKVVLRLGELVVENLVGIVAFLQGSLQSADLVGLDLQLSLISADLLFLGHDIGVGRVESSIDVAFVFFGVAEVLLHLILALNYKSIMLIYIL